MDFSIQIQAYQPKTPDETETKAALLKALAERGERLYTRESADLHLTASAMILDPSMEQALMVFHNIYQSYSWTGGHADGAQDLLATAIREAKEETGVTQIYPLSGGILSLDSLDVIPHQKHGRPVPAHKHFTVSYGLIAPLGQTLSVRPEENSAVTWLPADRLPDYCTEAHMWPLYAKLLRRMRALREEKKAALFRLPELLLPWYEKHARDLPWRKDRDPYHVWLSEIMLQQTRVEAVKAYYERFLAALPDIQALAEADESLLFKLWEGLGYYRRAKHLQEAARRIVENFDGQFPSTFHDIRALPGVGDYTAGAIASQCFDQPTPALDGNVLRVLARYMEDYRPLGQTAVKKELKKQLAPLYPAGRCGDFTQSLMELGATVCLPNGVPLCHDCPLQAHCAAYQQQTVSLLPVRAPKAVRKKEQRSVFLLRAGDKLAVRRRPGKGLLAGMWELPNVEQLLSPQEALAQAKRWQVEPLQLCASYEKKHIFTHIEWQMIGYEICCRNLPPAFIWADEAMLDAEIALPTAFRQFLC